MATAGYQESSNMQLAGYHRSPLFPTIISELSPFQLWKLTCLDSDKLLLLILIIIMIIIIHFIYIAHFLRNKTKQGGTKVSNEVHRDKTEAWKL